MARATTKPKKEISMEEALWKSADKLRGAIEPAEYKHVVLSLFFLKFASDKFVKCREKIIKTHGEKYADMKPFYTQENVFYLPEESRWSKPYKKFKKFFWSATNKNGGSYSAVLSSLWLSDMDFARSSSSNIYLSKSDIKSLS